MKFKVVKIRDFIGHRQSIYCMSINNSKNDIYSSGGDGMIVRWNLDEQDGILIAKNDSAIFSILYHDDKIFSGTDKGELIIIDALNLQTLKKIKLSNLPIFDIQCYEENIYISTGEGHVFILNHQFIIESNVKISHKSIRKMIITHHGFFIAGSEPAVWQFNKNWQLIKKWTDSNSSVFALFYHKKSHSIFSGGRDAQLNIQHLNHSNYEIIKAHLLHVNDMQADCNEKLLLTASMDKTIKIWDLESRELLKVIDKEKYDGHTSSVNKIIWLNETSFLSCSDDRTLKYFEITPV